MAQLGDPGSSALSSGTGPTRPGRKDLTGSQGQLSGLTQDNSPSLLSFLLAKSASWGYTELLTWGGRPLPEKA